MAFQAYNEMLVVNSPIKNVSAGDAVVGYEFQIQYPSYRGTFLSCIEELRVWVDGEEPAHGDIYILLNGKQFLIDELAECFKEYWFVLDYATVRVMRPGGLAAGEHDVRVYLKHRIPYTGYAGQCLSLDADKTRTLALD